MAYTWIGVTYLSVGFYFFGIGVYQLIGRIGPGGFANFVDVTNHVLGTRSISWILIIFAPICGIIFDVCGKAFSNMFYPTQTQIHIEIESKQRIEARKRRQSARRRRNRASAAPAAPAPSPALVSDDEGEPRNLDILDLDEVGV